MRIISATIKNFRSITSAYKIPLTQRTILIGANNEGKSNVVGALVVGMRSLRFHSLRAASTAQSKSTFNIIPTRRSSGYDWERDFPIQLQNKIAKGNTKTPSETEITLEFELDESELADFRSTIKSSLNGSLPIRIRLGRESGKIEVVKPGRGSKTLNQKGIPIALFVAERIDLEHIPAVRTADAAREIVESLVDRELSVLERDNDYKAALARIAELQRPILDRLQATIAGTLKQFLRNIKDVELRISESVRLRTFRRSCEIWIDDGYPTPLEQKGDGVKSLAALALMRQASEAQAIGKNFMVAIEEPESHLHPAAIHELRSVIADLSNRHQTVVTTHNPLFVDRVTASNNIIVSRNRAQSAEQISDVRKVLGVRASDNLQNASLVVLVEGDYDKRAMMALLRRFSPRALNAIQQGMVVLDILGGGSKLGYKASLITASICSVLCFLDNDLAGRNAFAQAKSENVLTDSDAVFARMPGRDESEFEDLISQGLYLNKVRDKFGCDLQMTKFGGGREKWSTRIKKAFEQTGAPWSDKTERQLKQLVCECVEEAPEHSLVPALRGPFDSFVANLEARIDKMAML